VGPNLDFLEFLFPDRWKNPDPLQWTLEGEEAKNNIQLQVKPVLFHPFT